MESHEIPWFQTTNQFIDTSFWHMMKTYLSPLLSLVDLSRFQISVQLDLGCTSNIVSDDENFCRGTSSGFRNWHMSCLDMILCWYNMFLHLEIWKMRTFHRSQASGKRKVNIVTFCCGFRTRIFIIEIYIYFQIYIFSPYISIWLNFNSSPSWNVRWCANSTNLVSTRISLSAVESKKNPESSPEIWPWLANLLVLQGIFRNDPFHHYNVGPPSYKLVYKPP